MYPLERKMVAEFGTMPEFRDWDTAWILSDGTFVPRGRGSSLAHHDMLREVLDEPVCTPACINTFMHDTGAIRVTEYSSLHLPASKKTLTPRQMKAVKKICKPSDGCEFYFTDKRNGDCSHGHGSVAEMFEAMERCQI